MMRNMPSSKRFMSPNVSVCAASSPMPPKGESAMILGPKWNSYTCVAS